MIQMFQAMLGTYHGAAMWLSGAQVHTHSGSVRNPIEKKYPAYLQIFRGEL